MTTFRPDLVECWVFRIARGNAPEYLLIRRAPDRIYPGLWQCVTGSIDEGEEIPTAALREVAEETGFGPDAIEGFFDLEQVETFYSEAHDALVSSIVFALRVRPDAEPRLSTEHDGLRWATRDEALRLSVWPAYHESLARIERDLADADTADWFELDLAGRRLARPPRQSPR
jgi:8-oxo-dGTP pyrophosphatase MutT (NUDIX family)